MSDSNKERHAGDIPIMSEETLQPQEQRREKTRVFISYAHADDETFVKKLRDDLHNLGYEVWRDRESLPSRGLTFHHEIRDAIVDQIDKVILVVGPEAIKSKYVEAEWKTGQIFCKTIIPILRWGEYEGLPEELIYHCPDFRETTRSYEKSLEELLRHLETEDKPLGEVHNAPQFPPRNYLHREKQLDQVSKNVLQDLTTPVPIDFGQSTVAITSFRGGGTGKSVLANAFVHQCEVRRVFPGGIFWVEGGENKVESRTDLAFILNILAGTEITTLSEQDYVEKIKIHTDKNPCLFVLDDVWNTNLVEIFQKIVSNSRSKLIITTRNSVIAQQAGETIDIGLFSRKESKELLLTTTGLPEETITGELSGYVRRVLDECGNLPLALRVAGLYIGNRIWLWESLVNYLENGNFDKLNERFHGDQNLNLFRLTQASAERLLEETQILYTDLALFPKDALIPITQVRLLWAGQGYSSEDIDNFLAQLDDLGLVDLENDGTAISLHDLQWDYILNMVDDLPGLHSYIVDRYKSKCPGGWHTGPDDGYFYENLLRHLYEAGRTEEIIDLFLSLDWIIKKLELKKYLSILSDHTDANIFSKEYVLERKKQVVGGKIDFREFVFEKIKNATNREMAVMSFTDAVGKVLAREVIPQDRESFLTLLYPELMRDVKRCPYLSIVIEQIPLEYRVESEVLPESMMHRFFGNKYDPPDRIITDVAHNSWYVASDSRIYGLKSDGSVALKELLLVDQEIIDVIIVGTNVFISVVGGKLLTTVPDHRNKTNSTKVEAEFPTEIRKLRTMPDNQHFIAVFADGLVRMYNKSLESVGDFDFGELIENVVISKNGKFLVIQKAASIIHWELGTNEKQEFTLDNTPTTLAISENGESIAYGNSNGEINLLNVGTASVLKNKLFSTKVTAALFLTDTFYQDSYVVFASEAGEIKAISVGSQSQVWEADHPNGAVLALGKRTDVDEMEFMATSADAAVSFWRVVTDREAWDLITRLIESKNTERLQQIIDGT